jgi:hypothetical protein
MTYLLNTDGTVIHVTQEVKGMGFASNNLGDVIGMKMELDQEAVAGVLWTYDGAAIEIAIEDADVDLVSMNDLREIVGNKEPLDDTDYERKPFLWTADQGLVHLSMLVDPSEWKFDEAISINNAGEILLYAHKNKEKALLLLTPKSY